MSDKPKKPKPPSATVTFTESGRCFVCKTTEQVVNVSYKDGSFSGVLCTDHVYEHLQPEVPHVAESAGSRKTA